MENTCFRDSLWLQENILTKDTVTEYFSYSQFYDKNCNNEVLKMQNIHQSAQDLETFLSKMCGVQYTITYALEPALFIIKKCERLSPEKVRVIDYFYVMNGTVYQAPTEKEVFSTRYTNILFSMFSSLENMPFLVRAPSAQTEKRKGVSIGRMSGLFNAYAADYMENKQP
ncbi:mediator of RNA polymerase II transcription subunit 6 [Nematocida ausubeli]|uniref:Mediator of RNA polymerase II transcription subunit 6 n=1 Tax=Nematocida ausubeli (strain ATCC PRA-371 / ERTm2) TaxID=1913371 RepID=H8ZCL9_NEMA1|nr:uncharacterized protein NESG_02282 [Nematocida ausubeli]EHY65855.1 hypothetical protein NERG_01462 [Nematocida ausubeli]KAI5133075.1 mediator of RNA polymerase II transcription subunit 6 [Nematocida ausubeli]KAI5133873.1 mediator of RNA polymerase II transcription subunit 6 [Nematocida ausubeli]KAI5147308.1 mediator of RNA polymerase II transcription subunit 6 [Nematocida ausubeli]KAI5161471.1 mediator of RNA polymerase II transcription subunit 6 [Nematocida ausubeli]